jgi:hypothetical protein
VLALVASARAHLNLSVPHAAIEYNPAQAAILHGSAEAFDKAAPVYLRDLASDDASHWLAKGVSELTVLRGYAHVGSAGLSQAQANANVAKIQIWSWDDTNGNGAADAGDATTAWTKEVELTPSGGNGNAVGHAVAWPLPAIHTSTWQGDLLQGRSIELTPGRSLLLLIRVVDISGNTNLMAAVAGLEQWDNGAVDGVGSDVSTDAYLDADGNTPETTDARIEDEDVVWLYVPRLK